jgi:hypothetical protein
MRSDRVNCRLDPDEVRMLRARAREVKMKPTSLLRQAALAYLRQRFLLPPQLEETLVQLLQETRRIGTNLNQIAAKTNSLQRATGGDLRRARKLLEGFEAHLRMLDRLLHTLRPAA